MKNNLRTIISIAVLCLALGGASEASGQIKTGGYKAVPVADPGVKAAAEFAVQAKNEELEDAQIELEEILSAERQTVAGANYRLCLLIKAPGDGGEDVNVFIRAVIFRSLKGELSLKSWAEDDACGEQEGS